jgi:hypothetical protein
LNYVSIYISFYYEQISLFSFLQVLERNIEKFAQARFYGPLGGTVLFRWLGGQAGDEPSDMIIHTDLHHIHRQKLQSSYTEHHWKIYATDIFESGKGKYS